jgi:hypothetical protein
MIWLILESSLSFVIVTLQNKTFSHHQFTDNIASYHPSTNEDMFKGSLWMNPFPECSPWLHQEKSKFTEVTEISGLSACFRPISDQ